MKRIIFLVLLLALSNFLHSQLKGSSPSGRLFPKKEPPQVESQLKIEIISPLIKTGDIFNTVSKTISLKGRVTGDASKVFINDVEALLLKNNEFVQNFTLTPGKQDFKVIAFDSKGKSCQAQFSINCDGDFNGPYVFIIDPKPSDKNEITVKDAMLTIHGQAVDESGIREVIVNGEKARIIQGKEFYSNISLLDGLNSVLIKAVDSAGNSTEKRLRITRSADITGPVVTITEPSVSRGIKVISKKELLQVKGVAVDESGVDEVLINDRRAVLSSNGQFSLDISLQPGDNRLIVQSFDKKRNLSIDTFIVNHVPEETITPGRYFALIIGIDRYKGVWPELKNAVRDAREVENVLRTMYRFDEVFSLYDENATRSAIIEKFELLVSKISREDNLLVFYSGHGEFRQQLNKGYWVPVDAVSKSTSGYISNSDIQTFLNGILSKHTLLVSDACFSGDIFRGRTEELPFENSERYFKEVYRRSSRYALTSGGIEPVMDNGRDGHSIFTYYFLQRLKSNTSKYFTAGQLFQEIQIPIANNSEQTPIYQPIKNTGDEGGQFIFMRK